MVETVLERSRFKIDMSGKVEDTGWAYEVIPENELKGEKFIVVRHNDNYSLMEVEWGQAPSFEALVKDPVVADRLLRIQIVKFVRERYNEDISDFLKSKGEEEYAKHKIR
ncbi:hypothetical protein HYV50_04075 [Candidatus Pacearchaeota archaeon]|nr:hypothetical protein [Candidatus Pacearchaeota archaeon]